MAPHRIENGSVLAALADRVQQIAARPATGFGVSAGGVSAPAWADQVTAWNGLLATVSIGIGIVVGVITLIVQVLTLRAKLRANQERDR